jgi:hypothetical protein
METKQFVKNLLLRAIPFFVFTIAIIVLKVADVASGDWWGWYVMYVLIFVSLAYALYYGIKNSRGMIIENVKKSYIKKVAKQYLAMWEHPEYNTGNIINYIYQNERNFDRTILFTQDDMTIEEVIRDSDGMVTGEKTKEVVTYQQIESMCIVDIGMEGSAHIELTLDNGNKEYVYFDLDIAKFFMAKTGKQIDKMDDLKAFYIKLAQEMII